MAIKDMDELIQDSKPKKEVSSFIKSADMSKTVKGKGGRPKKSETEKANKQIFVNLTEEQKIKLDNYSNNMGISTSAVVKMLLSKEGII